MIIGANPKVALEIEQTFGAEKGCRGDAVLLYFYSPERQQTGERRVPPREPTREPTPRNRPVHPVRPAVRRPFLGDAIEMELLGSD